MRTSQNQQVLGNLGYTCIFNNLIKITEMYLPLNHFPKFLWYLNSYAFVGYVYVLLYTFLVSLIIVATF